MKNKLQFTPDGLGVYVVYNNGKEKSDVFKSKQAALNGLSELFRKDKITGADFKIMLGKIEAAKKLPNEIGKKPIRNIQIVMIGSGSMRGLGPLGSIMEMMAVRDMMRVANNIDAEVPYLDVCVCNTHAAVVTDSGKSDEFQTKKELRALVEKAKESKRIDDTGVKKLLQEIEQSPLPEEEPVGA